MKLYYCAMTNKSKNGSLFDINSIDISMDTFDMGTSYNKKIKSSVDYLQNKNTTKLKTLENLINLNKCAIERIKTLEAESKNIQAVQIKFRKEINNFTNYTLKEKLKQKEIIVNSMVLKTISSPFFV